MVAPKEAAWGGGENVGSGVRRPGANPSSDTRQLRTVFLPLGKQLLILLLGASANRSSTPSTRQIRKMVLVSQACTSPGQIFSLPLTVPLPGISVLVTLLWMFCSSALLLRCGMGRAEYSEYSS